MSLRIPDPLSVAIATMVAVFAFGVTPAQEREAATVDEGLREHFGQRLRSELSLSDEQVASILPEIEALERTRSETRANRTRDLRRLREAYEQGSDDAALEKLLTELDASQRYLQDRERATLEQIDQGLTVRQRVQLRFFLQTFRREMQQQIRQLRRDRAGPADRAHRRPGDRRKERP